MSALFQSIKARLLAAAFACLAAFGTIAPAAAGPVYAQAGAPNLGASRATETLPSVPYARTANVGNPVSTSAPEKRVALVIGNSAYEHVTALPNPANDAKAIGQFLNSAGFEVIQATDLDHDEMIQVLQDFSARIAQRGPDTVAFVYYAGHGLQIAGDNYLVPVDAKISSEADVPTAAVRLVDVMATLQAVPSRMRAVILDACRNNPFTSLKDTGRGLAIVDAPNGSIVAYSTAPGTEAFDGEGKNSPYTAAFLRLANEPNMPIEQFFKKVRVAVNDVTDGKQTPWESSSLTSDFYFFGDTAVAAAKIVDPIQSASASVGKPTQVAANMRSRSPREAYNMAVSEGSVVYYQEFVRIYPHDPFADHIRRLLAARLVALAWHGAVLANSPVAYKNFYSQYSDSPYATLAMKLAVQPKVLPLYQPTKIMIAPQIAPQVKLTTFNGVAVGEGNNAPVGLGGNGSLFNKKFGQGSGNQGLGLGGLNGNGQSVGLPANGKPLIGTVNGTNGGQGPNVPGNGHIRPLTPGIDLAKGTKRIDTTIGGGRLTTLPGTQGNETPANGAGTIVNKNVKVLNGNVTTNAGGRINNAATGATVINGQNTGGRPLIKQVDRARVGRLPAQQVTMNPTPTVKRHQPGQRLLLNGSGNGNSNSAVQFRATKPVSHNTGSGGSSFAGGGMSFGRSFR